MCLPLPFPCVSRCISRVYSTTLVAPTMPLPCGLAGLGVLVLRCGWARALVRRRGVADGSHCPLRPRPPHLGGVRPSECLTAHAALKTPLLIQLSTPWFKRGVLIEYARVSKHSPCSKHGLSRSILSLIASYRGQTRPARSPGSASPPKPSATPSRRSTSSSWSLRSRASRSTRSPSPLVRGLTAAIHIDNPYCSCTLTRVR